MSNSVLLLLILLDAFVCLSAARPIPDSPAAAPTGSKEISSESQKPLSAAPEAEKKAEEMSGRAEGQETLLKRHHHGVDKSVAGGGVILGGLATTFLVAVFCYIRATARHPTELEATA